MPSFKAFGMYIINCTAHKELEIATAACEYWAKLPMPPVPPNLMEAWILVVRNKLGKLLSSLLNCMLYHEKHVECLELQQPGEKLPSDMGMYTNKRNYAALGFENLCQIFQGDMATAFKPHLQKRLNSENWLEVEAVVLALGAMMRAAGALSELGDVYPVIIPQLLDLYSHQKPLVRSIVCFTMQNFINVRMKNVKDPFPKVLKSTLSLLRDELYEVQEMALQSLAAILAYAERDISPQLKKVSEALVRCNETIKGKARFTLYECIGHIFGRASGTLDDNDAKQLVKPLMEEWESLQWTTAGDSSSEVVVRLCQSLCVVALYHGSGFQPYNETIFSKTVPYLQGVTGTSSSDSTVQCTVAALDLLSAIFEGQGSILEGITSKYKLGKAVVDLLKCDGAEESVHQSALALLGHLSQHCCGAVKPYFKEILATLDQGLSNESAAIQNNSLWTLAHITANHDAASDKLLAFAGKLRSMISQLPSDNSVAIHAALALTNLAKGWPDKLTATILKDDIFQPLCYLLQAEFPRDLEKVRIFSNLCAVVAPQVKAIRKEGWLQFCTAAAILDCSDAALDKMLQAILKDVRTHLGHAGWTKLSQQMGAQLASALRKRYKLY